MRIPLRLYHPFNGPDGTAYLGKLSDGRSLLSHSEPPVMPGLVLQDSIDDRRYILLNVTPVLNRTRVVYYESEARQVNTAAVIQRFQETSKNSFGRSTGLALETIAADVPAYLTTSSALKTIRAYDEDGPHPAGRMTALVPDTDIKVADRLVTDRAEVFQVENVDKYTHPGLLLLTLSPDSR
jgi:hypothetical protein